jgi:hypothetical protein
MKVELITDYEENECQQLRINGKVVLEDNSLDVRVVLNMLKKRGAFACEVSVKEEKIESDY